MPDLLVKLYDLPEIPQYKLPEGVTVKRVMSPDIGRVMDFIKENFSDGWAWEASKAMYNQPSSCFIAVKEKQVIGFACYDTTALDYFGPLGVKADERKGGIGGTLTLKCLYAMKEKGYGYAIIGSAGPVDFYRKVCGATVIESANSGVYINMINKDN